jgi:probable F420-dependent oxidoreductase
VTVRFGIGIPNCREGKVYPSGFTTPQSLAEIACYAEQSGFDFLWGNDLQTMFDEARDSSEPLHFYELHTTFAYLAAMTSRIQMLSAALTLPLRDPILVAKETATLDQLSAGRYVLGVGIGGKRTELERLRGRFSNTLNRGAWLDESIELIRALFERDVVTHDGKYFSVQNARVYPKPGRAPFPIYFTGGGEDMLRRTAQYGAGWIHMNVSPAALAESIKRLRSLCYDYGTSFDRLDRCLLFDVSIATSQSDAASRWDTSLSSALSKARGRGPGDSALIGEPQAIVDKLLQYVQAGATHFGCIFAGATVQDVRSQIKLFSECVIPQLRVGARPL